MLFTNTARHNFAKDPAVVKFKGKYFLYYTILYTREPLHIGVGIATSTDGKLDRCRRSATGISL